MLANVYQPLSNFAAWTGRALFPNETKVPVVFLNDNSNIPFRYRSTKASFPHGTLQLFLRTRSFNLT
jgi:hypothetical protein